MKTHRWRHVGRRFRSPVDYLARYSAPTPHSWEPEPAFAGQNTGAIPMRVAVKTRTSCQEPVEPPRPTDLAWAKIQPPLAVPSVHDQPQRRLPFWAVEEVECPEVPFLAFGRIGIQDQLGQPLAGGRRAGSPDEILIGR